jgi:hypothetical protein
MRAPHSEVKEPFRVEQRPARLPELTHHRPQGSLGGLRAVRVSTHSIDHCEEQRIIAPRDGDSILVLFTIADEA